MHINFHFTGLILRARANTNRYSLENVLLSFFHPLFSASFRLFFLLYPASPHRFHPLRPLLSSIIPLLSAWIREGRRKVLFCHRGVFHFHPRVPPSCPSLASLRFFACRLNFTSAYLQKFLTMRERRGKDQMEISYTIP